MRMAISSNPMSAIIPAIVEALGRLLRGLLRCAEDWQQTVEMGSLASLWAHWSDGGYYPQQRRDRRPASSVEKCQKRHFALPARAQSFDVATICCECGFHPIEEAFSRLPHQSGAAIAAPASWREQHRHVVLSPSVPGSDHALCFGQYPGPERTARLCPLSNSGVRFPCGVC